MDKKIAFWIFLLGTLSSSILFLILTIDTHKQVKTLTKEENLSAEVVSGKKVWEKYNCNDCHTILGFGGYYAPDMTKAYKRLGSENIKEILKVPDVVFANSKRKMPKQNIKDEEIENLISFLKWVSEIDNNDWPPQDSEKKISKAALRMSLSKGIGVGASLFQVRGCLTCHTIDGKGGKRGPDLFNVSDSYDIETLRQMIKDPKSLNPASKMPPQKHLTEEELEKISEFLINLK